MRNLRLLLALSLAFAAIPFQSLPLRAAAMVSPAAGRSATGPSTVNFNVTGPQLSGRYAAAQTQMTATLQSILQVPEGQRSFANTVKAIESASAVFSENVQQLIFLAYVSPNAEVKAAAQQVEEDAGKFGLGMWTDENLYKAVQAVVQAKPQLSGEDKKLLENTILVFKNSGMGLSAEERAKLRGLRERLTTLESEFSANLNNQFDGLTLTAEQLKGLPEDYVKGLAKTQDGKYKVTLSYPDYLPFMKYAADGQLRQALQLKYANRAAKENGPLLVEALKLRGETAKMLGYESYPHLALEGRMAENPSKVWAFLNRLWPMLRGKGTKDLEELNAVKAVSDPKGGSLKSWELSYYANKLRMQKYALDSEEVKKYFPVDTVLAGTMKVYQRILGVTFTEVKDAQTWHPDVKLYEITDTKTGARIGHFYLDLYPRAGKYGHAAAFTIVQGRELEGQGYRETVSAMVANFPKATPDAPALLPHADVETFFHEFGHLMHQTLTKARYATFAGSSVAQDFVEAPSQMLENFVWNREVLNEISGYYQDTSKKLPDELFKKMVAAKNMNNGLSYLTQLAYAMIDMMYHTAIPAETSTLFNQMMEVIGLIPVQAGNHSEASFGHLMGGYGAGYYSYLWSEVYAHDIFSVFEKEGVLNPEVGMRYRRTILEKGSSQPEGQTLREFLQREPSEESFLTAINGEPEAPKAPSLYLLDPELDPKVSAGLKAGFEAGNLAGLEGMSIHVIYGRSHYRNNPLIRVEGPQGFARMFFLHEAGEQLRRAANSSPVAAAFSEPKRFRWWNPATWFSDRTDPTTMDPAGQADLLIRYARVVKLTMGVVAMRQPLP